MGSILEIFQIRARVGVEVTEITGNMEVVKKNALFYQALISIDFQIMRSNFNSIMRKEICSNRQYICLREW